MRLFIFQTMDICIRKPGSGLTGGAFACGRCRYLLK